LNCKLASSSWSLCKWRLLTEAIEASSIWSLYTACKAMKQHAVGASTAKGGRLQINVARKR